MQNKVLVTGANGQLGTEIVAYCVENSIDVISMTRHNADITDKKSVDKFILYHQPTHIIHCAAWTSVDLCEQAPAKAMKINSEGTKNIVSAAKDVGAHVTYISTDYVFNGEKKSPYTEDDKPSPISVYGVTKLMGERATRKTDAIVRVSWVCGETGSNIVKTVLQIASEEGEMSFVNDQYGSPTFADDAAREIVNISISNSTGIWHVSNSGTTNWYQFVKTILEIADIKNVTVKSITSEELHPKRPARRPQYSALKSTKSIKMDDWKTPLERLVKKLTSS